MFTESELTRMLAFVGISVVDLPSLPGSWAYEVKLVQNGDGCVSYGEGDTRNEAMNDALHGQNIDWYNVREKMFDQDVVSIMRT